MHAEGSGFRLYDSPKIKLLYDSPKIKLTIWMVGAEHLSVSWPIGVQLVVSSFALVFQWYC